MDEQIEDEIEKGIIPDPSTIDPITGEPLPPEGDAIAGEGGEVPIDPATMEADPEESAVLPEPKGGKI